MWMNSRFAQWEVEGQVRERVSSALRETEQSRMLRAAQNAGAGSTHRSLFEPATARLNQLAAFAKAGWRRWHAGGPGPQEECC
jgi:hypothetical protein